MSATGEGGLLQIMRTNAGHNTGAQDQGLQNTGQTIFWKNWSALPTWDGRGQPNGQSDR